jgi:DMSO/TMAO reductase YedYZ heme-binding membrane subunit
MRKNIIVFGLVFLVLGASTYACLQQADFSEESFRLMLRYTARIALLIYLVIFIARPLRQLSISATSKWLLKNRRYLGISFAAVMTVHLIYLVWLNGVQPVFAGMAAFALIYLMLVTSFDKPAAMLGPRRWRMLHKVGIYAIGFGFASTVFRRLQDTGADPVHLSMAALMLVAIGVRITAFAKTRS